MEVIVGIDVKLYNTDGTLYSKQGKPLMAVNPEYPFSIEDLEARGFTFPVLQNIGSNIFACWVRDSVVLDMSMAIVTYSYHPKYVSSTVSLDYCDSHMDDVDSSINEYNKTLGVGINKDLKDINHVDNQLDTRENVDTDISSSIARVAAKNDEVSMKISSVEDLAVPEQLSLINIQIRDTQRRLGLMNSEHEQIRNNLKNQLDENNSRLSAAIQSYQAKQKNYYFVTESDYEHIASCPDRTGIYFVKEE